jgi:hypothetical protein
VSTPSTLASSALALAAIAAFFFCVFASIRFVMRDRTPRAHIVIANLAPSLKLLLAMTLTGLLAVQAVAVMAAYTQTQVVHGSTYEYFQYISRARLLGTSHSHLFGYALTYGLFAFAATMTTASERLKCTLVATMLWAGLFDVLSWWGIKEYSARFEWLSIVTGMCAGTGSLVAFYLVIKSAFFPKAGSVVTTLSKPESLL